MQNDTEIIPTEDITHKYLCTYHVGAPKYISKYYQT